jgi:8-oxo-dGTP diphosphatase
VADLVVVAAVIERDGRFLVTRRLEGTHLGGCWEFPGGKVQQGERHEEALARELSEELDSGVANLRPVFTTAHRYADRTVELHFFRGDLIDEPRPALGQEIRWIGRGEFASLDFPPADAELIDRLVHARL